MNTTAHPTLYSLQSTDRPVEMGGEMLGDDGQGNQLWIFPSIHKLANRYQDGNSGVWWSGNIYGWGYTLSDAID